MSAPVVPATGRWTARLKNEVVDAVRRCDLTFAEACARYGLTGEELGGWMMAVERVGRPALRLSRLQQYRHLRRVVLA